MYHKNKGVSLLIEKRAYRTLETEARKRKLGAGEYLEMLVEMDYICNNGGETPEEQEVSNGDVQPEEGTVSISEKHYRLLSAREDDRGVEEAAAEVIHLGVEMLPERPISKRWFESVVNVRDWAGNDSRDPGGEPQV